MRKLLAILLLSCFLLAGIASADYYNFSPYMTSDTAPAGNVTSAVSTYSGTYSAWKGMDGSAATWWTSTNSGSSTTGWWWRWNAPFSKVVTNYTVWGRPDDLTDNMRNWTLLGSNDGVTWTVIDTRVEQTWATFSTPKSYPISNTQPYSYYNVSITRCSFTGTNNCGFGDIAFYENTTPINASFTQSPNPSIVGQPVTFRDISSGLPITWSWSATGGSSTNATQAASYAYTSSGTYNIFLNVTNSTGYWSNTSQTHTVIGKANADFYMPANGTASETTFYDLSPNARMIATFGDTKIKNSNTTGWRFNNASYFDGTGDVLYAPPGALNFGTNYPVSVAFWVNSTSATTWNSVVGNLNRSAREDGEVRIASRTNGGNAFAVLTRYGGVDIGTFNSSVNINDGKWHWIVATRQSATNIKSWVDGVQVNNDTINAATSFGSPTRNLTVGWNAVDNTYVTGYIDDLIILNGTAIDGSIIPISEFVGSTTAAPPVASFTASNTSGIYPPALPVRFTDTSTNTPTSWQWNATNATGNNTPFTFATTQNPLWYFDIGNYSISLNATNAGGSDVSDQATWINVSAPTTVPAANFTANGAYTTITGTAPFTVNFVYPQTNGSTSWSWIFGDGNTTGNTDQNPVHLYTLAGTYSVNHSATNVIGIGWKNVSSMIVVSNATGFVPQDIWMEGQYLQTWHITSSSTGLPIPTVELQDTSMQAFTTTNGTGYLTEGFGASTVTFISEGYSGRAISYFFDSAETHDVQLTPATPGGTKTTFYIPQQVRIRLVDQNGKHLSGVHMTATPLNFTAPEGWLATLIGIDPDVNMQGTTLLGNTASDGSWAAPMLASFEYDFTITDASRSINMNVTTYPSQTEYVWMIPVGFVAIETPSNIITYSLGNVTINQTREFINMSYADSTTGTTYLQFAVFNTTGHMVYSANYTGAANCANKQYSQEITHSTAGGDVFTYGIFASQSQYGWINQTQVVTFNNQIALIGEAPGWVEYWLSVGLIIILGASFGLLARRFALIVVSLLAWFLQFWMGWFNVGAPGAVLFGFMFALGVLIYIRESENKLQ